MSIIYCRNYKTPTQKRKLAYKKAKQLKFEIERGIIQPVAKNELPKNMGNCLLKNFFNLSGVYFLYQDSQIVYVGESGCILSRIKQHTEDKDFNRFTYMLISCPDMRKVRERDMIRKHRPKYNTVHNKDFDSHKQPFIK